MRSWFCVFRWYFMHLFSYLFVMLSFLDDSNEVHFCSMGFIACYAYISGIKSKYSSSSFLPP